MIHLELITLSGTKIDEDVFELMLPTTAGVIAINQDHAPLLGAVAPGLLQVRKDKATKDADRQHYGVYSGTVEVLNNTIRVLVDELDSPGEVSAEDAEKALQRAKDLKAKAGDSVSLNQAQAMIDRQAVRLQLANIKRRSKRS